MKKTLEDLQVEQRAGVQRIAAWAGEASTALVPLGVSPIPVSELPTSISDVLPVLDSAADCLRCLDQILGARLEAEGGRLCWAVIEYILTRRELILYVPDAAAARLIFSLVSIVFTPPPLTTALDAGRRSPPTPASRPWPRARPPPPRERRPQPSPPRRRSAARRRPRSAAGPIAPPAARPRPRSAAHPRPRSAARSRSNDRRPPRLRSAVRRAAGLGAPSAARPRCAARPRIVARCSPPPTPPPRSAAAAPDR
eukprot:XP_020398100.1 serine/arginine repetitive matrix protein 1-like [Zea mays]